MHIHTRKGSLKMWQNPSTYRKLTAGEIELAQTVYQNSLDYDKVRVHKGRFIPLFQREKVAMSPFGTMHFPPALYEADFSTAIDTKQHLFIHEMAHIWQYQLGLRLWLDGIILTAKGGYRGNACYQYESHLTHCQHFSDLNMEQQADVIADWFIFKNTQNDAQVQILIRDFIHNPNNPALLPKHAEFRLQAA